MGAAVLKKQFESVLGGAQDWQSRPEPELIPYQIGVTRAFTMGDIIAASQRATPGAGTKATWVPEDFLAKHWKPEELDLPPWSPMSGDTAGAATALIWSELAATGAATALNDASPRRATRNFNSARGH